MKISGVLLLGATLLSCTKSFDTLKSEKIGGYEIDYSTDSNNCFIDMMQITGKKNVSIQWDKGIVARVFIEGKSGSYIYVPNDEVGVELYNEILDERIASPFELFDSLNYFFFKNCIIETEILEPNDTSSLYIKNVLPGTVQVGFNGASDIYSSISNDNEIKFSYRNKVDSLGFGIGFFMKDTALVIRKAEVSHW